MLTTITLQIIQVLLLAGVNITLLKLVALSPISINEAKRKKKP